MDYADIKLILALIAQIFVSIVVYYIKMLFPSKNKKDNTWIKLLSYDDHIKSCIEKYKEIESPNGNWVVFSRLLVLFIMVVVLIVAVLYSIWFFVLSLFFFFIFTSNILIKIRKRNEDESLLKHSKQLATLIIFVNWFTLYNILFTIGGIYTLYSVSSDEELFVWNEIPGSGDEKLIGFLKDNYESDWIKPENIDKIDEKTIKIFNGTNLILLRLNDDRAIVNLTINDGRFGEFDAKMVNHHKLSIYPSLSITQFLYDKLTFLFYWILFLAGTIFISDLCRKELLLNSKILLNKKYRQNFPYVNIKTDFIELKGRVWDIFDENLIFLENYNQAIIKTVKWDSIKNIELYNYKLDCILSI